MAPTPSARCRTRPWETDNDTVNKRTALNQYTKFPAKPGREGIEPRRPMLDDGDRPASSGADNTGAISEGPIRALVWVEVAPMTSLTSRATIRSPRRNYYMGRLPIPADHKVGGVSGAPCRRNSSGNLRVRLPRAAGSASASRRAAICEYGRREAVAPNKTTALIEETAPLIPTNSSRTHDCRSRIAELHALDVIDDETRWPPSEIRTAPLHSSRWRGSAATPRRTNKQFRPARWPSVRTRRGACPDR